MLQGEKTELSAGQQIEEAGEVLIKWGDAQGINGAVERVVGLADEDWEDAGAELEDKVGQHIRIPKGIAGADLAGGREGMQQPRGGGCEQREAGDLDAPNPGRGGGTGRRGSHANYEVRAANWTVRSNNQPRRRSWMF